MRLHRRLQIGKGLDVLLIHDEIVVELVVGTPVLRIVHVRFGWCGAQTQGVAAVGHSFFQDGGRGGISEIPGRIEGLGSWNEKQSSTRSKPLLLSAELSAESNDGFSPDCSPQSALRGMRRHAGKKLLYRVRQNLVEVGAVAKLLPHVFAVVGGFIILRQQRVGNARLMME